MGAVVVCFDGAAGGGGIGVECIKMGAQLFYGLEVLWSGSRCQSIVRQSWVTAVLRTWSMLAPVSRTLLSIVRGSPGMVSSVGAESIVIVVSVILGTIPLIGGMVSSAGTSHVTRFAV